MRKSRTKKKESEFYLDRAAGLKVVKFIETFCRHVKGELAGKNLKLLKWQKNDIIIPGFGMKSRKTGLRKYQTIYVEVPKKNGKSTLAAPIGKYLTCADGEPGAEVYACAGDREQARIVFGTAKDMVEKDPILSKALQTFKNSIFHKKSMSTFKVVSAEAYTKEGINVHGALFDETHIWKNDELYNCFVTATISRKQPLIFIITTAGVKNTFGHQLHEYALKVRDGVIKDDTWLSVIYSANIDDDPFDPKTWKKANPMYGVTLKKEKFEQLATRARNEPSFLNAFKRYHLNIWVGSQTAWIPPHEWDLCNKEPVELEALRGRECYGGLDLGSVRDLTSFGLYFPPIEGEKYGHIFCVSFCPEETVLQRIAKENTQYGVWVEKGYVITTPGNATDYRYVSKKISEIAEIVNIKSIAYDRMFAPQTVYDLQDLGFTMSPFGQGFRSMSTPSKELESMVVDKRINHGGNPVLNWMIGNVKIQIDRSSTVDNIKPVKSTPRAKIDGIVAIIMAIGEQITQSHNKPKRNKYNDPDSDLLII